MQMVEVTFDGYMETLEHLRHDDLAKVFRGSRGDLAWNLFVGMVGRGEIDLAQGPLAAIRHFSDNAQIVYADFFERDYPKYSEIMTWHEFVRNECIFGDDEAAVLSMGD